MSLSVFIFYLNSFTLYGVFFAVMSLASVFSYIIMCSVPAYVAVIFGVIGIFGMKKISNISAAALHRFIPMPASSRFSV
jgi:hypothetical protein